MKLPNLPTLPKVLSVKKSAETSTTNSTYYTVVDVGSSAIRAAIIESQPDGIHVLGYGYVAQQTNTMNAGLIANLEQLAESMDEAVTKAINQAGVTSEQLILGLGGALVAGVSTLARLNRPQAKDKIDKKELQDILERIAQNVLLDNQSSVAQAMALKPEQVRLVNAGITRINIDGYTLASPLDFSGKEIEACLYTAYVAESTIVALQHILEQLNVDLTSLTSEPYALASLITSTSSKPQQANAIVIDIGAGTTSATLVENGAIASSQSYPVAGQAITARLAHQLSIPPIEAEQLKIDYSKGALTGSQLDEVKKIVKEEVDIWLHSLSIALTQLETDRAFPDQLYLAGGASQLPDLQKALNSPKLTKALGFSRQPTVEALSLDILPKFFDQTKSLGQADIALAALSFFWLQRQQEDPDVAVAFQRIIQDLS